MAWTQLDLAIVKQARLDLAAGKRRVKFVIDGEVAEYALADLNQLKKLQDEIEASLDAADPESDTVTAFCFSGSKGL